MRPSFRKGVLPVLPGIALLVALAAALTGCETSPWKDFHSMEGGFSVSMPGTPVERRQAYQTQAGPVEAHFFTVEADRGSLVYMVVYGDYPEALMATGDREMLLDAARDGAVGNIQGTLLSERAVSIGGHPGRELQVLSSDGRLALKMRIYLVNNRQYQVVAVTPKETRSTADRDRFLDSFRLKGN
ncbi:MAG: hypothetical protein A4E67_02350 [Syntrophaceae bacterium PtaB.Bin038]|nr:MAG: hypothetical protein A4E67_02350 [Syntrophaceae bacterium PtaB.Bin038]